MDYGGFSSFLPIAASSHVGSRGPSPGLLRVCEPQDSHVNLNVWGVIFQEKDHSLKVSPPKVKTPQLLQLPHFMKGPVAWRGVEPHPLSATSSAGKLSCRWFRANYPCSRCLATCREPWDGGRDAPPAGFCGPRGTVHRLGAA